MIGVLRVERGLAALRMLVKHLKNTSSEELETH